GLLLRAGAAADLLGDPHLRRAGSFGEEDVEAQGRVGGSGPWRSDDGAGTSDLSHRFELLPAVGALCGRDSGDDGGGSGGARAGIQSQLRRGSETLAVGTRAIGRE